MSVRAKFVVNNITPPVSTRVYTGSIDGTPQYEDKEIVNVSMVPVTRLDLSEENKEFFASTPSGLLNLGMVNADAANQFVIGKEYYLDFTAVEDDEVAS